MIIARNGFNLIAGSIRVQGLRFQLKCGARSGNIATRKYIEYGAYGDLILIYANPYSIYLRGTILVHSGLRNLDESGYSALDSGFNGF